MSSRGNCIGCGSTFGIFNKEHGCKNCRSTFCSKCLSKKAKIPNLNNAKHDVCLKCYNMLTKTDGSAGYESKPAPPPDTYYKRIAELSEAQKVGQKKKVKNVKGTKSAKLPSDEQIEERLGRLHQEHKLKNPVPSVSEISMRLKQLKGEEMEEAGVSGNNAAYYPVSVSKTEQEQVDDLMASAENEVNIDRKDGRVDRVEDQLASLNIDDSVAPFSTKAGDSMYSSDEDISADAIIKQILDEAKLDEKTQLDDIDNSESSNYSMKESDGLCCICEEEADVRCRDCDDLYCTKCHKKGHSRADLRLHRTTAYVRPDKDQD